MARLQPNGEQIRQALQGAPQLRPFIISNVRPTGKQLGEGSYGTVEELEIDGLVCAGKKLYDALIDPENQGAQRMVDKYYNECRLLSDLRHPHIVQFLGICFLPDSRLPVLVMERLQGSLDELLENTADIPLSTKVSILQDVARGLVYLHHRSPSVIHRDLSARNVLVNYSMTAKIADLGNSRIVDIPPGQLVQTMTQGIPGTQVYMPPEVSDEDHKYGPSLDMFSFGHLSLFVAIQVFPQNLLKPTYQDPKTKKLEARSELERRGQYINILHQKFGQCHPLVVLIKGCLEYEPVKRPTARQALERLGEMRATVHVPYSDLSRLQLEKSLTEKETEIQQIPQLRSKLEQLTVQKVDLEEACRVKDEQSVVRETEFQKQAAEIALFGKTIGHLETQLQQAELASSGLEEVCKGKDEVLAAKEQEIAAKEGALSDERQRVSSLTDECATLKGRLERKTEEIESLQAHVKTMEEELARKAEKIALKVRELLSTTAAKDRFIKAKESEIAEKDRGLVLLQQRCGSLQTQLETVQRSIHFLEAGYSASGDLLAVKDALIAALQTELRWKDKVLQAKTKAPQLPSALTFNLPMKWKKPIRMPSGMCDAHAVVIGGKVYVGGGETEDDDYMVLEYTIQGGQWRKTQTPVRYFGMAVVDNQLVISGGQDMESSITKNVWVLDSVSGTWIQPFPAMPTHKHWHSAVSYKRWMLVVGGYDMRCVEVLDTISKQWYSATTLPHNSLQPSLIVIQDTLYVAWRYCAFSTFLPTLISDAMSQSPTSDGSKPSRWQPLPDTLTKWPTVIALHGSLVAMGGDPATATTFMYLPQTEQWLKVAELPTPRRSCTCTLLSNTKELMVIGGTDEEDYIKSIDICTYN